MMDSKMLTIFAKYGGMGGLAFAVFFLLAKDIIAEALKLSEDKALILLIVILCLSTLFVLASIWAGRKAQREVDIPSPTTSVAPGQSISVPGDIKANGYVIFNQPGESTAERDVIHQQIVHNSADYERFADALLKAQDKMRAERDDKHGEEKHKLELELQRVELQLGNLQQTYDNAIRLTDRLRRLDASDPGIEMLRAKAAEYIQSFELGAAEEALVRAEALDLIAIEALDSHQKQRKQSAAATLASRGDLAKLNFDHGKALQLYLRAIELLPQEFWLFIEAGRLAEETGNLGQANALISEANILARSKDNKRDISVALNELGDVQVAQGDLKGAEESFQEGLKIAENLAASDPSHAGWQRDLSVSHDKLGDVQVAQGDLKGAEESFQEGLKIAENLAASDPSHAGWQRDLSVSHNKLGDVQVAQGDLKGAEESFQAGLKIRENLAASDPSHAGWQRDLSVSHERLGDVQVAQGDLKGAEESFQEGLKIRENLAASDPSHAGWQRDLSVSHNKLGDVQVAQGDLKGAEESFQAGLKIRENLAASDPSHAGWQRDLALSYYMRSKTNAVEANTNLAKALAILEKLEMQGKLPPNQMPLIEMIKVALSVAE